MPRPSLLLLDNRDSFTFMLADTLVQAGAEVCVRRPEQLTLADAMADTWQGIVVSPGPGHPRDATLSVALAGAAVAARRPYFGVCLGHQALALALGGQVDRAQPVHGKTAQVRHDSTGLFAGLPDRLTMTRYHSLAVVETGPDLVANAWVCEEPLAARGASSGEAALIMGMRHRDAPAHGVQFHPESIASPLGPQLCAAFVALVATA